MSELHPWGELVRDQFVGDTSDLAKYALFFELAEGWRAGVLWYASKDPAPNSNHGNGRIYLRDKGRGPELRRINPKVADTLTRLVNLQTGGTMAEARRRSSLWPRRVKHYSQPIAPLWRTEWFNGALAHLKGCRLVLVDPDDGLATAPSYDSRRATPEEVCRLLEAGASVVLPEFGQRKAKDLITRRDEMKKATRRAGLSATAFAVRWISEGVLGFIVVPRSREDGRELRKRAKELAERTCCFEIV
jgi:hypothetical protein